MEDPNENKTHYLYFIESLDNKGIYVGVTINPKDRWATHKRGVTSPKLASSIKKYGQNRHVFYIKERFETKTQAYQKEIWWIAFLRKVGARVFNISDGGIPPPPNWGRNKLNKIQVEEIRAKYNPGIYTYKKLSKEYGVSPDTIKKVVEGNGSYQPDGAKINLKFSTFNRDYSFWVGETKNNLTVIRILDEVKNRNRVAELKCLCGFIKITEVSKLKKNRWTHEFCPLNPPHRVSKLDPKIILEHSEKCNSIDSLAISINCKKATLIWALKKFSIKDVVIFNLKKNIIA